MEIPVFKMDGKSAGTMTVDEQSLGGEVNPALLKQAFVMYHANTRQGSARTKTRSMVEGSTRKLYKQKGTGNSRVGPARVPGRKGGSMAHAKLKGREDYHLEMPRKMKRKANRNALLAKLLDNEVKVLDTFEMKAPKTKSVVEMLEKLGVNRSCLVAVKPDNDNVRLAARNVEDVTVCNAEQLTCFEMLNHRFMVISKADLEAWLSGPSSKTDKSGSRVPNAQAAATKKSSKKKSSKKSGGE
ncbi:MAG: 50S ribosomal protein L4 [Phycisphaerales bacterium]|nr:50S ribosomal protein L4 [Phycisphaerales bacterium]